MVVFVGDFPDAAYIRTELFEQFGHVGMLV